MERKGIYDVAIIGGGIMGAATAYYLARAGVSAALFEKGRIGGEQSSRNWGAVRQQERDPAEVPLMMESVRLWEGIEEELGAGLDWRQEGHLSLAYDEKSLARYSEWLAVGQEFGLDTKILTSKEVHQLLPHYEDSACRGGIYTASDGCAEPVKVAAAFAHAARVKGADVFEWCSVSAIEDHNGSVCGLITEQGRIKANAIIVTAGAWTSRILQPLGIAHPSLWIRGSVGRTSVMPIDMRKLVVSGRCAYRQRADGRVNIAVAEDGYHDLMLDSIVHGPKFLPLAMRNWRNVRFSLGKPMIRSLMGDFSDFTTHRTLDPQPDWNGLNKAARLFVKEYPGAGRITYERGWAGYIDYMPDELPVMGGIPGRPGLYVAAGFSGHGFGMGPVVGRAMADLVQGKPVGQDLGPFRPERFSAQGSGSRT
ncbi:FAD-binding oxidoreductase [Mesorhizobium sp.]|uniref:NAD(P)/FAD-dependent oxidoreductase n=3 Tax=unclassified Mesorhizobium TaxID=325217 RepID=UPI000FE48798|nr:FAD-binding oxidoreductase [Mesorhizobium sp.]RWA78184.1 MAG: FAD-binding oxidoreductase [Mesorhizobium sp.]TIS47434.1 MAG: FAD-binding oxidoreductase [Mesorhizobium sp.]